MNIQLKYPNAALFGLIAGIVMAMVAMMATAILGMGLWAMPAMIAGLILGPSATMDVTPVVIIVGLMIHMALSMMFGIVYAAVVNTVTRERVLTGLGLGLLLWVFNFYVLGLFIPGARMMADHEPLALAVMTHLIFGGTLAFLAERSLVAPVSARS